MNKKTLYLTVGSIGAVLLGVVANVLVINSQNGMMDRIKVTNGETVEETLEVKNLKLLPGESQKYTLLLSSELNGKYLVAFNYKSQKLGGLENFLDVTISHEEEKQEYLLADLLTESTVIEMPIYLDAQEKEIEIVYSIDEKVENEAQGTYVDFQIELTISSKV